MSEDSIVALALDQSPRATGWAIGSPCQSKPTYGLFKLGKWHDREGEQLHAFSTWLFDLMRRHKVTHVFYEAPADVPGKAFTTTNLQAMQEGIIHLIGYTLNVADVRQITVSQMRERFLGTSKAAPGLKGDMAREWWKQKAIERCAMNGWLVDDDNVAEALGHLDFGLSTLSKRHASRTDIIFHRLDQKIAVQKYRGEFQ